MRDEGGDSVLGELDIEPHSRALGGSVQFGQLCVEAGECLEHVLAGRARRWPRGKICRTAVVALQLSEVPALAQHPVLLVRPRFFEMWVLKEDGRFRRLLTALRAAFTEFRVATLILSQQWRGGEVLRVRHWRWHQLLQFEHHAALLRLGAICLPRASALPVGERAGQQQHGDAGEQAEEHRAQVRPVEPARRALRGWLAVLAGQAVQRRSQAKAEAQRRQRDSQRQDNRQREEPERQGFGDVEPQFNEHQAAHRHGDQHEREREVQRQPRPVEAASAGGGEAQRASFPVEVFHDGKCCFSHG